MAGSTVIKQILSKSPTISVNIIDCDLMKIADQVNQIEKSGIELLHFVIKDGCFVPEITFGPYIIQAIKTPLIKDVHLMIHDPAEKTEEFVNSGADIITLHIESDYNLMETLKRLGKTKSVNDKKRNIIRGIAMNPDIPVEDLAPFLNEVELVSILATNPKVKNGKKDDMLISRIKTIKKMISYKNKDILLSVNGGIDIKNIKEIADLGVNILVVGAPVFDKGNIVQNIEELMKLIKS